MPVDYSEIAITGILKSNERESENVMAIPLRQVLKKIVLRTYYFVTSIPVPFPRRLAWGDWWLSWNDQLGGLLRSNAFESAEQRWITRLLKPGMVVIDAGAHRGYYTLLASSILGNEGKVISFEPSPRERRWLGLHVKINGRKNVVIEKSALGSKEGAAEFYLSLGHQTGCSSLRPPKGVKYNLPVKVPVVSLDQYSSVSGIPRIDFMKIDVEGAERDVILGGRNRLTRDRPIVLCELSDLRTLRWNYRPVETVKLLEKLDYHCYLIQPDGSLADHREKAVYEDNVLAIPNEKLNALPKGRA